VNTGGRPTTFDSHKPQLPELLAEIGVAAPCEMLCISSIKIGERIRKDVGDIDTLARSMSEIGMLEPIGVTTDHQLVFGERRILAAKLLGWETIAARIVDTGSIIRGEYAENEIRKDFTPSERLAIAEAIEKELGERRGRPAAVVTKGAASARPANDSRVELTHAEMKADLEKAGIAHLIKPLMDDNPGLSEEMAIEHLHSFL
jgi:ParB-like chromosome segregation protein Spo0J